jgi:hypothetical protein
MLTNQDYRDLFAALNAHGVEFKNKLAAGRPQDLADVEALKRQR